MLKLNKTIIGTTLVLTATLNLIPNLALATQPTSVKAVAKDALITSKIKALYANSSLVKASDIQVTTVNRNVILMGQVKTPSQYERAITLADLVPEVQSINADNLNVKASNAPLKDSYTTAKVKSTFLKEKLFGSKDIEVWPVKVETKDSVVYLTGKVSTPKERKNLIHLAKGVSGVSAVKSSIVIQ